MLLESHFSIHLSGVPWLEGLAYLSWLPHQLVLGIPAYSFLSFSPLSENRPTVGGYSQDPEEQFLERRYRTPLSNSSTVRVLLPPSHHNG